MDRPTPPPPRFVTQGIPVPSLIIAAVALAAAFIVPQLVRWSG